MQIHIICTKEELKKTDEIQEALSKAMKPLTALGFKGEISIEEAQDAGKMIINKIVAPISEESTTINLSDDIPPLRLSHLAINAGFGLEYWLHKEYDKAKSLLQDGVYFCAILDLGEDYEHATYANLGACEAVRLLSRLLNPTKLKECISEAREIQPDLLRLIEGNFSYPEYAISEAHIRKKQKFFNEAGGVYLRMALRSDVGTLLDEIRALKYEKPLNDSTQCKCVSEMHACQTIGSRARPNPDCKICHGTGIVEVV